MDFLRMEGETNFIDFMPEPYGENLFRSWYAGSESTIQDYVAAINWIRRNNFRPHFVCQLLEFFRNRIALDSNTSTE